MSKKRLSMRKDKEVLRLRFELGLDHRQIAGSCRVSFVTAGKYLARFSAAGLSWPLPEPAQMHRELRRVGVTLQRLWQEYREDHPEGYGYTQFCEYYRRFEKRLRPSLRQLYRAGEWMFVDFAGRNITLSRFPLVPSQHSSGRYMCWS